MSELKKSREKKKKYPTGKLLGSRVLAGYQQDFARVVLAEQEYTIEEARDKLDRILKGKGKLQKIPGK